MSRHSVSFLLMVGVLVVLSLPSRALARRRGFVLITFGDKVTKICDAAENSLATQGFADATVGYRYDQFGVFFVPIWTWGGEFCVYSDEEQTYTPGTPEELALITGVPMENITKPFFYSFPLGFDIILAIILLAVAVKIKDRIMGTGQTEADAEEW